MVRSNERTGAALLGRFWAYVSHLRLYSLMILVRQATLNVGTSAGTGRVAMW